MLVASFLVEKLTFPDDRKLFNCALADAGFLSLLFRVSDDDVNDNIHRSGRRYFRYLSEIWKSASAVLKASLQHSSDFVDTAAAEL